MSNSSSAERLNFIVATCAILISAASFYATYLQANSAEQQVKAMTWPLIEFAHGNYDAEAREARLTLTLRNAGVGPAIIRSVAFAYDGQSYDSLNSFLRACCLAEMQAYNEALQTQGAALEWSITTSPVAGIILPVNGAVDFLELLQHEYNDAVWRKINDARWKLQLSVCYCSLLETCYTTDKPGRVDEVEACPVASGG